MPRPEHRPLHLLLVLLGIVTLAGASIERLTLRKMIARADAGVVGEIVAREVVAVPLEEGDVELTFTTLTVDGHDLVTGEEVAVAVSYPGGVLPGDRGGYNAEAPSEDDVRLGNRVVLFHAWSDDMGGGFAGNALYAQHGGLFRTFEDRKGRVVVQGRGEGYAVPHNVRLKALREETRRHHEELENEQEQDEEEK